MGLKPFTIGTIKATRVYLCLLVSIAGDAGSTSRLVLHKQTGMCTNTLNPPVSRITSLPFTCFAKANAQKKYVWITLEVLRQAAEKRPAAFEATRAPLHYVYNCSVLKATFHVSCEAEQHCDPPVWASSLSDINANHCSQSINTERKVQFTSDPLLMS